jgi:hypothetical protein
MQIRVCYNGGELCCRWQAERMLVELKETNLACKTMGLNVTRYFPESPPSASDAAAASPSTTESACLEVHAGIQALLATDRTEGGWTYPRPVEIPGQGAATAAAAALLANIEQ